LERSQYGIYLADPRVPSQSQAEDLRSPGFGHSYTTSRNPDILYVVENRGTDILYVVEFQPRATGRFNGINIKGSGRRGEVRKNGKPQQHQI